ncbi:MAG: formamidopyrimidine-DNA glycosylase [Sandaracinus sp.]|nr:formamidopyrimidine-DNA glycosylase [Sandaracinus sp.]MCB9624150.1 formamidopyrimidine-DNA glycosylase [Sandaracinus sp.]MCB9636527.1 formamidopyrimidine-DNA glycosylase [Sandaracinus sp.]
MPELPDVELYLDAMRRRLLPRDAADAVDGNPAPAILEQVRLASPFLLRTVEPPLSATLGRAVTSLRRLGKRLVIGLGELEGEPLYLVIHLMIAGRLQWKKKGAAVPGRIGLAMFDFDRGSLAFTEASKKKRAKLHVVRGDEALAEHDPGGLEPLTIDLPTFTTLLRAENHTVKRTLTDPRVLSGIGNAYSDEILHAAKLPPHRWTTKLTDDEITRLHAAMQSTLIAWRDRLRDEIGDDWPKEVTAFRPDMAVHGKYKQPCPVCGDPVQRIAYADHETNYCATCQNGGVLLADRGLSRLLKGDWPKTLDQLEELKRERRG